MAPEGVWGGALAMGVVVPRGWAGGLGWVGCGWVGCGWVGCDVFAVLSPFFPNNRAPPPPNTNAANIPLTKCLNHPLSVIDSLRGGGAPYSEKNLGCRLSCSESQLESSTVASIEIANRGMAMRDAAPQVRNLGCDVRPDMIGNGYGWFPGAGHVSKHDWK